MLKLSLIDFFLRAIPESFLFILVGYIFSDKSVNKKSFFISITLLSISTYLVRMLPIHFGVHTSLLIMIYVLIIVTINKLDIIKSISAVLISSTIMFILEWINTYIVVVLLRVNVEYVSKNSFIKWLYFSPSLILFGITVIFIFYNKRYLRKVTKNVFSRKTIK